MFAPQTTFLPNEPDIAAKVIDGETIILNVSNSNYYSTIDVGTTVWELIAAGRDFQNILSHIADLYDVPETQVEQDIEKFVSDLLSERLIIMSDKEMLSVAGDPQPNGQEKLSYKAPCLDKYSDMADLLALDPPTPGLMDVDWNPDRTG